MNSVTRNRCRKPSIDIQHFRNLENISIFEKRNSGCYIRWSYQWARQSQISAHRKKFSSPYHKTLVMRNLQMFFTIGSSFSSIHNIDEPPHSANSSESGSLIACFRYNSGQLLSFSSERNSFRLEIAVRFLVLSKLMISYTALLPILFRFSSMFAIIFPNDHVMGSKVFNSWL